MVNILFWLCILTILCRIVYLLAIYLRLAIYQEKYAICKNPVSVVTCYYNEANSIDKTVPTLIQQDYKAIEYILVDDASSDTTKRQLMAYEQENVQILSNDELSAGKKAALAKGISQASHEWLLLTDGDTTPHRNWASTMMSRTQEADIVLGYAPLTGQSLIGKWGRYEAFYTAVQYLSYALAGIPYMGVGRNLLYKTKLHKAYESQLHNELASGDDDLLVNAAAADHRVNICLHPDSFVYSPAKESLAAYIKQKTRHISTSHHYRWIHKLLLGLAAASHIMMYVLTMILVISGSWSILYGLAAYFLLKWIVFYPICKKLDARDLWLFLPLLDLIMAIFYLIMIPFSFKRKPTWS